MNAKEGLSHVVGTFLIHARGSFLNGAGLGEGEDRNVTVPKSFQDGRDRVPYVSAQAWKRWLRNTVVEEQGWRPSELRPIKVSEKGTTSKILGEANPVEFPEDDIFGYMRAEVGMGRPRRAVDGELDDAGGEEGETAKEQGRVKAVMRASPFAASLLVSLRKSGWRGRDEGYVHLTEGTPLPYTTEFYNTHLQGVFALDVSRLGVFQNIGDRIELDETMARRFLKGGKIKEVEGSWGSGKVYARVDADKSRREEAAAILQALARLRGGAKQAAFGTDVSPKVLILAGLRCGNPIFNLLFRDADGKVELSTKALDEVIRDYADRIVTPVFVGIRTGYLANEDELREKYAANPQVNGKVVLSTPVEAADLMSGILRTATIKAFP